MASFVGYLTPPERHTATTGGSDTFAKASVPKESPALDTAAGHPPSLKLRSAGEDPALQNSDGTGLAGWVSRGYY